MISRYFYFLLVLFKRMRADVRIVFLMVFLGTPFFFAHHAAASHTSGASEEELRAAYVFNFASLVEWPARVLPPVGSVAAQSPPALLSPQKLVLCHVGQDEASNGRISDALARLAGRKANAREVMFKRLPSVTDLKSCHVAVIGELERGAIAKLGDALRGAAVVTIAMEGEAAAVSPEIAIRLAVENDRMVFDINNDYVKRAGLIFSSKLLRLSRKVL